MHEVKTYFEGENWRNEIIGNQLKVIPTENSIEEYLAGLGMW